MKEKDFQVQFSKKNTLTGCFELKFCKGTALPFSALAEHQEQSLLDVSSTKGLFHKISDQPIFTASKTRFTKPKPFDCFFLREEKAYVVVMFWVPREKKVVYFIRIQDWIRARNEVGRKSLTEEAAKQYAEVWENYLKI